MQQTDVLTWHYVFCMGMYRAFYILNWVWRYMTQVCPNERAGINASSIRWHGSYFSNGLALHSQEGYSDWIVWVSGVVQTVLYLDFFYYYIKWCVIAIPVRIVTTNLILVDAGSKLDGTKLALPQ